MLLHTISFRLPVNTPSPHRQHTVKCQTINHPDVHGPERWAESSLASLRPLMTQMRHGSRICNASRGSAYRRLNNSSFYSLTTWVPWPRA